MPAHRHNTMSRRQTGVTLLETVISMVILAGAFAAALNTISGARASQAIAAQQRVGMVLAEDLLAEVLSQTYKEDGSTRIGIDTGEVASDRSTFDDVDDYDGWKASPPVDSGGRAIAGADDYSRTVSVGFVQLNNPSIASVTDQGMKEVTVKVWRGAKQVAELSVYRSDVYDTSGGW